VQARADAFNVLNHPNFVGAISPAGTVTGYTTFTNTTAGSMAASTFGRVQAAFDPRPFVGADDARYQVERKDFLRAGGVTVDVERDAHVQQQPFGGLLPAKQLAGGQRSDDVDKQLRFRTGEPAGSEYFIVEILGIVAVKFHDTSWRRARHWPA